MLSHGYGWGASCPAGGVTAVAVGCSDLLGEIGLRTTEQGVEAQQLGRISISSLLGSELSNTYLSDVSSQFSELRFSRSTCHKS
jgi:hypothetical protein